ncbi:LysE family translocator [Parapedomonas caeni]
MNLGWLATYHLPVGMLIGLVAAAPIGPVNIIVIQRTLQKSIRSALALGLGAALGDAVFAAAAAFGLTALKLLMDDHHDLIRVVGGLIMIGFAVVVWRTAPHLDDPVRKIPRARHMALATFMMTVTNPATLLWFAATFGSIGFRGIGHESPDALINAAEVVIGVFLGSMLWWLFISGMARWARGWVDDRHLLIFNHVSAVVLLLFGLAALAAGLF